MQKKKSIVIIGPTAVGKTATSIKLAQKFNGEIISGDSMQIYRHLDIGTSKVKPVEKAGIRHYLLDIRDVDQHYTVYEFQQTAQKLIIKILQQQHLPFIVGGTGFYIKALVDNLNLGGPRTGLQSAQIRQKYSKLLELFGAENLWQMLLKRDPKSAARISPQNSRRVIRALEVLDITGKQFSQQWQKQTEFEYLVIGLTTKREILYQQINQRVDLMLKAGLKSEAAWLYEISEKVPQASQGIGYKEFFPYFDGKITYQDAVSLIKRNSRRFAKRQLTYFRHQLTVHWFDIVRNPQYLQQISALINKFQE